jgi:hypothetical protein
MHSAIEAYLAIFDRNVTYLNDIAHQSIIAQKHKFNPSQSMQQ